MSIFDELRNGVVTTDVSDTYRLGRRIADELAGDTVIGLQGDLGAGKTTLVQGMVKALGITDAVKSPTYNIFSIYSAERFQIVHMDAYRLTGGDSVNELMLEEFLNPPWLLIVEWPENIADWMPEDTLWLQMSQEAAANHRKIILR